MAEGLLLLLPHATYHTFQALGTHAHITTTVVYSEYTRRYSSLTAVSIANSRP